MIKSLQRDIESLPYIIKIFWAAIGERTSCFIFRHGMMLIWKRRRRSWGLIWTGSDEEDRLLKEQL